MSENQFVQLNSIYFERKSRCIFSTSVLVGYRDVSESILNSHNKSRQSPRGYIDEGYTGERSKFTVMEEVAK